LPVTLSAENVQVNVSEGETESFSVTASYTGTSNRPVVADVSVNDKRFALESAPVLSESRVTMDFKTKPFAPGGKTTSTVTFRLCTSVDCTSVYPGSQKSLTVDLDVRLHDWSTFQRNAAHTGYVAVNYNANDFVPAWVVDGTLPQFSVELFQIAARRGAIFVNIAPFSNPTGNLLTRALSASTGAMLWEYDLGRKQYFGPPSYSNGRVVSAAMALSSRALPIEIIDADNGRNLRTLFYSSQFALPGALTPFNDNLYLASGFFGNEVFSYDAVTGTTLWIAGAGRGNVSEGLSVAVDEQLVYMFTAGRLTTFSRTSGAVTHMIDNPFFSSEGVSYLGQYFGAPILDGTGRVFTFLDNKSRFGSVPLMAFSINTNALLWRTSRAYAGDPAYKDGNLYAIRANSAIIDIIDVTNGSVSRSINLGADKKNLTSNIVLTNNHLFVASNEETYAVDLQSDNAPVAWSTTTGGVLAITPDNLLVISAANGGYRAFRLY
jgi:outer membrane protein assembly factor BamB